MRSDLGLQILIGYARISKADESQVLDLQIDALIKAAVDKENIYTDKISGVKNKRPGLESCLKALRKDDTIIVQKLDKLGRNLKHLITTVAKGLVQKSKQIQWDFISTSYFYIISNYKAIWYIFNLIIFFTFSTYFKCIFIIYYKIAI